MFWFFIPVLVVLVLIVAAVAIYGANARRRGGQGARQSGRTVYDEHQRRAPDAPPAQ